MGYSLGANTVRISNDTPNVLVGLFFRVVSWILDCSSFLLYVVVLFSVGKWTGFAVVFE